MVATLNFILDSPEATEGLARGIAQELRAQDILLLSGEIGAGKSNFARALIDTRLSALGRPEDIPSPTFTLVQTYEAGPLAIWHCDLYRLSGPDEVEELGLTEAFSTALCLVEWPDRLGPDAPDSALTLSFEPGEHPDQRQLAVTNGTPRLMKIFAKAKERLNTAEMVP